jgi:hypothetical protein
VSVQVRALKCFGERIKQKSPTVFFMLLPLSSLVRATTTAGSTYDYDSRFGGRRRRSRSVSIPSCAPHSPTSRSVGCSATASPRWSFREERSRQRWAWSSPQRRTAAAAVQWAAGAAWVEDGHAILIDRGHM